MITNGYERHVFRIYGCAHQKAGAAFECQYGNIAAWAMLYVVSHGQCTTSLQLSIS